MAAFSAKQLEKFAPKKQISQETFDAAVKENMEEFEMEGVDLGNIIKSLAGGDLSGQPGAAAVVALDDARLAGDVPAALAALAALQALVDAVAGDAAATRELLTVLHKAEAAWAATRALGASADAGAAPLALPSLRLLAALLAARPHQQAFLQAQGPAALASLLRRCAGDAPLVAAALAAAAASAARHEEGKAAAMERGLADAALAALATHARDGAVVRAASGLLSALATADDDGQPSSAAFANARALARDGAAAALVGVLRGHEGLEPQTTAAACGALRQVSANEEICQEVAAAGGVGLALAILRSPAAAAAPPLARAAAGLLRQLASSDGVKAELVEAGGLQDVKDLLQRHADAPAVVEQALGLLAAVTLRNPEASTAAVEGGVADALLAAARALLGSKEGRAGAAQRQACMALRNMAGRCPELRPALLQRGAEPLLRSIRRAHPSCADVGSAALRDLGLDNYND